MRALVLILVFVFVLVLGVGAARAAEGAAARFRAGAHQVRIDPEKFPVRVNAMFTERSADRVVDALFAKALVVEDDVVAVALCVVDSCMVPRSILDAAKVQAARSTGIPADRIMISSTHTHSAPSAMGCLGSREDPEYAARLPGWIAEAIEGAARARVPARVAWTAVEDWDHTFNRRWIRRPDRLLEDPFGNRNVRAHMHPGHQSRDVVGPSGPVDPALTLLAVSHLDGRPLAVLANYSQHYYGSPLLSADYYGAFARALAEGLGAGPDFVGILSQGTSGDLMWMDYAAPARDPGFEAYGRELAGRAIGAYRGLTWRDGAPVRMAERRLTLGYRVPELDRLAWARRVSTALGDRLPNTQPEIYAREALALHERQTTELKLQALRIGDLAVAALPNEVFALTGLRLKAQSPLPLTMNVSLANGAEGYIPPPEQHRLGGYTTWPARTAGLETNAEPRIVDALLGLLEKVSGAPRRKLEPAGGPYPRAVLADRPLAYWRLDDATFGEFQDASGATRTAVGEGGLALYLPGAGSGSGVSPAPALRSSAFSETGINRSVHLAGGNLRARLPLGDRYTVELWVWNGLPRDAREVTGSLVTLASHEGTRSPSERLEIAGTGTPDAPGRLRFSVQPAGSPARVGRTPLAFHAWHQVVLVRDGTTVRVHLDGRPEPELAGEFPVLPAEAERTLHLGGGPGPGFSLEGRLDEVSVHGRALGADEIASHYRASGLQPPSPPPESEPLTAAESLRRIHVPEGFRVELAAAEPLTVDPVAIDWDGAGRMWVVEMADYPLGMDGRGRPGGRVRVLEDTDANGTYDRSTLFAEGLSFPTGILTWRDGVLVTAAPEILHLRDTDGDLRADVRTVVVSGLTEGNQQLRANGLRWGLDAWVYCAAGGHHGNYGVGTRLRTAAGETLVGSRDFRFKPDTGELEPESGPSQFGRNRDDWGRWFGTQNIRPLWHYVLSDPYLRRNPHVAAPDPTRLVVVPLSPPVYPASRQEKRYHSFNEAGHFTSACGGMIYRDDRLFPAPRPGPAHAFTCEPFHNLVQHNLISDDGVSFTASRPPGEESRDFFASEDRWCRPVMVRTGPDGALWVVDMYRYMIEHPEWLPAEGRAELLPHYRLGDDRGRIYRVVPARGPKRTAPRFDRLSATERVALLDSPNGWQRDKVHQLLIERPDPEAIAPLLRLARDASRPLARLHAAWVLDAWDALPTEVVADALNDPHPGMRENALRLAERRGEPGLVARAAALVDDPSARVRLQLAFSLGAWREPAAGVALGRLAVRDGADPMIRAAVLSAVVPHLPEVASAAVRAGDPVLGVLIDPLIRTALGLRDPESLARLLSPVLAPDASGAFSVEQAARFTGFLQALARQSPPSNRKALAPDGSPLAMRLGEAERLFAWAVRAVRDAALPDSTRVAAATLLAQDPEFRPEALRVAAEWLGPRHTPGLRKSAIGVLAASADEAVPDLLLGAMPRLSPEGRQAALDALLSREPWTLALLERGGGADLAMLDATRRSQLLRHGSSRVREAAGRRLESVARRREVLEAFRPALGLAGDHERGRTLHARLCAPCHRLDGVGIDIGPDLRSVAAHPPEKLLANILDPSADIQPGYQAYQCRLADGTELYGLIATETASSLAFRLIDGTLRAVSREEIAALEGSTVSLMPEGLEAGLKPQDLADLIAFLRTPPAHSDPR